MVQWYSQGGANVPAHVGALAPRHLANTIELMLPSAHLSPQPKQQIDRFLHSSRQKVPILYSGQPFPAKIPPSNGDMDPI